ncbi:MAG: VWA domain-containing protein [Gemmatimonadetes bacterium]|nr:VWA domain-containing protein [Gemmatimonadota bacterium]
MSLPFAQPGALILLLVLPALWVIARAARAERRTALSAWAAPGVLARTSALPEEGGPRWRTLLRWAGLACVVVALARPQIGRSPAQVAKTGRDLIVALDLSRSMKTEDVGQDRLSLAKRLGWQLAAARAGDRVGLVIFGGGGFLQLPPTTDLGTFQLFLDAASYDDIADPATDVAAGLRVAERVLRREGAGIGSRAVLLLSDGERSEGPLDPVLDLYRHARLPVFVVGVGTRAGGQVPADTADHEGEWHLDGIGRPVVSRLAEEDLQRIAEAGGGAYARWDDKTALDRLARDLSTLQPRTLTGQPADEPTEWYQFPLALGLVLLLADLILANRPRGRPAARPTLRPQGRTAAARSPAGAAHGGAPWRPALGGPQAAARVGVATTFLLTLLSCTPTNDAVRGRQLYEQGKYLEAYEAYQRLLSQQGGPAVRFNAGNSLYRLKQYNDAASTWREAMSGDDRLRQQAFFNMGNAYVRAAEDANALSDYLGKAIAAYEEALRLDPTDRDAKWNLEIALQKRGDVPQQGSRGRGGRADYGRGNREEGYEENREAAVGAMAGGGQGGDEGESVEELNEEQARSLLDAVERQQLNSHEGKRPKTGPGANRDW